MDTTSRETDDQHVTHVDSQRVSDQQATGGQNEIASDWRAVYARADANEIHRLHGRCVAYEAALRRIRALDLGRTPTGRDDFYTGPDRFFQAWQIARHALSEADVSPSAGETPSGDVGRVDPERKTESLEARLKAFLEIHEHWEFGPGVTEESFDEWLHENIREMKRALSAGLPMAREAHGVNADPLLPAQASLSSNAESAPFAPALRNLDTPENREFWASVDRAVADWERIRPEWSRHAPKGHGGNAR